MFIHFGINTFHNTEWSDGSHPASSYAPTTIDAKQWVGAAKRVGMKYIILVSKHHEGFCLWDSRYTEYDVANSGNKTNVIEAVAKECKSQGIGLGLYYSLWDRKQNPKVRDALLDEEYNKYMINQINELLDITQKYVKVVEFWFDGGWEKASQRWPLEEIYRTIKTREPQCQIGVNWSIGTPDNFGDNASQTKSHMIRPENQKVGDPIRHFPSDFRLGDPLLPANPDPKLFTYDGKSYYMPWESTVCLSQRWFYHENDKKYKTLEELVKLFEKTTSQDNILIINTPPTREGRLREKDIELLCELRKKLNIK